MAAVGKRDFIVNVNNLARGVTEQGFGLILALDTSHDIPYSLVTSAADLIVDDISKKTVDELKEYVEKNDLDVDTSLNKAELVAAIQEIEGGPTEITEDSKIYKLVEKLFMQKPAPAEVAVYGEASKAEGALNDLLNDMNDDWFHLVCTSNTDATIGKLAKWATANDKIYYATSQNKEIGKDLEYNNAFVGYHHDPKDLFVEGLAAYMAVRNPGSTIPKFKTIEGSTVSKVSATEMAELEKDNVAVYRRQMGINHINLSKATGGVYLDITLGSYWLKFRMEEGLFLNAVNKDKIAYDNKDIAEMSGIVRGVLNKGASPEYRIVLVENEAPVYEMKVLKRQDMSKNKVANRDYDGINVDADIAGAIEGGKVNIDLVI